MRRAFWILLFIVLLLVAGCRQQATPEAAQNDVTIDMHVEPETPAVGDSTLRVQVTNANGDPITDAKVSARGDMNHAGMQPVLADATGIEQGKYVIPFQWTMAGDWIVEITVELADGTKVSKTFDLSVSGDIMPGMSEATETMDMGAGDVTPEATETMNMGNDTGSSS